MKVRPHFSNTVVLFFRYGYLLLIPLLQLLTPGAGRIDRTVLLQLITACGMLFFFELRRRNSIFLLSDGILTLRRGILFRSQIRIDLRRTVLHLKVGPFLRMLGGVKLIPEPDTVRRKKVPFSFYLWLGDARALADALGFSREELTLAARSGLRQAFTSAVFSSNSHIGFLALAPLLQAVGRLFEIDPTVPLLGAVSRLEQFLSRFIPPLLTGIAALLIAGYLLSIAYLTERSCRFCLYIAPGRFAVAHGVITRYTTLLPADAVPMIAVRATTLMRACSAVQLLAITPNPAVTGGKNTLLVPLCPARRAEKILPPSDGDMRIPKSTVWRVYLPVLIFSGIGCAVGFFGGELFPALRAPLAAITALFTVAALAALIPCSVRERRACLSPSGLQIQNTQLFSLFGARLSHPPSAIILTQSPGQREENLCSVTLRPHSAVPFRLSVPHLPLCEAQVAIEVRMLPRYNRDNHRMQKGRVL